MRNARRVACVAAVCGLLMASCSSEPEVTAPVVELSTTTVTTLPPTTVTTEAPTTTVDPRIAEVEAAVAEYRRVFVDVLTDPEVPVENLEAVADGDLLEVLTANVLKGRAEGSTTEGDFLLIALGTEIQESVVTHRTCGLDALAGFSADGSLEVPADESYFLRNYTLEQNAAGVWQVVAVYFPGSEKTPCEI